MVPTPSLLNSCELRVRLSAQDLEVDWVSGKRTRWAGTERETRRGDSATFWTRLRQKQRAEWIRKQRETIRWCSQPARHGETELEMASRWRGERGCSERSDECGRRF